MQAEMRYPDAMTEFFHFLGEPTEILFYYNVLCYLSSRRFNQWYKNDRRFRWNPQQKMTFNILFEFLMEDRIHFKPEMGPDWLQLIPYFIHTINAILAKLLISESELDDEIDKDIIFFVQKRARQTSNILLTLYIYIRIVLVFVRRW
jgi:hypothetical protein